MIDRRLKRDPARVGPRRQINPKKLSVLRCFDPGSDRSKKIGVKAGRIERIEGGGQYAILSG